jgi:DNA-binding transcriptional regulator YiaG
MTEQATKLKMLRERYELTQDDCAKLLHVTRKMWQNYEYGRNKLPQAYAELLVFKLKARETEV